MATERTIGALVLLSLIFLLAGFATGAGGVGIDTRSEYFYGDGPHSWRVVATQHRDRLADGLIPLAVGGAAAMATSALLYRMLKSHPSGLVAAAALGLLAAGALILVFVGTGFWATYLAGQWWESRVGVDSGSIADSAFAVLTVRFFAAFMGFPLLLGSLIAFGVLVQHVGNLPRWLMAFPAVGGALLVISPIGFAVDPGFFFFLMASGIILLLWLVVLSGRLILRGMK